MASKTKTAMDVEATAETTTGNITEVMTKATAEAGKDEAKQKFTVERLQADCRRLFGVSTSTFAGAAYGMTGKYTIEEMKAHIDDWKKKGVR